MVPSSPKSSGNLKNPPSGNGLPTDSSRWRSYRLARRRVPARVPSKLPHSRIWTFPSVPACPHQTVGVNHGADPNLGEAAGPNMDGRAEPHAADIAEGRESPCALNVELINARIKEA